MMMKTRHTAAFTRATVALGPPSVNSSPSSASAASSDLQTFVLLSSMRARRLSATPLD